VHETPSQKHAKEQREQLRKMELYVVWIIQTWRHPVSDIWIVGYVYLNSCSLGHVKKSSLKKYRIHMET